MPSWGESPLSSENSEFISSDSSSFWWFETRINSKFQRCDDYGGAKNVNRTYLIIDSWSSSKTLKNGGKKIKVHAICKERYFCIRFVALTFFLALLSPNGAALQSRLSLREVHKYKWTCFCTASSGKPSKTCLGELFFQLHCWAMLSFTYR